MKVQKPQQAQAAVALHRARQLVLYLLITIGTCTLITAVLLLIHTLDMPSRVLVTGHNSSIPGSAAAAAGRSVAKPPANDTGPPKPLSKELDPDFVDSAAQKAKSAKKACAAGCEIRGNCNAEEGR